MGSQQWGILFAQIMERLSITIAMLIAALILGLILGTIIAIIQIKRIPFLHQCMTLFISFSRCTPLLVQLFLVYFGVPQLLSAFGIYINDLTPFIFAVVTFALHISAYLAEVIRSAYLAVGEAQLEACHSVGMTTWQGLRRVVFPQMMIMALPNMGNIFVNLIKSTSLAFAVKVVEIMAIAKMLANQGYNFLEMYLVAAVIYWVICLLLEVIFHYTEKRLSIFKRAVTV